MENKYIGIKNSSPFNKGNMGEIFEKNKEGIYICKNNPFKKDMKLSENQIKHDLALNYLAPYTK
jgi:hypothetical protein